jgi:hypothetical protein
MRRESEYDSNRLPHTTPFIPSIALSRHPPPPPCPFKLAGFCAPTHVFSVHVGSRRDQGLGRVHVAHLSRLVQGDPLWRGWRRRIRVGYSASMVGGARSLCRPLEEISKGACPNHQGYEGSGKLPGDAAGALSRQAVTRGLTRHTLCAAIVDKSTTPLRARQPLTFVFALVFAPAAVRRSTTSAWPFSDARYRGVAPFCRIGQAVPRVSWPLK